ncbi:ppsD [Symbiodinium natans]|uniref:PpsD protein n=1 Tax=Symbiodinium natans TaxID=878477 RepID=A0A812KNU2_9DINO|nr:ppsD [Symbiodinium natans]
MGCGASAKVAVEPQPGAHPSKPAQGDQDVGVVLADPPGETNEANQANEVAEPAEPAAKEPEVAEKAVQPCTVSGELGSWEAVKKLRISQPSADRPIHLKQVEIFGVDGVNYALKTRGGQAEQSSMQGSPEEGYGPAELVIDGCPTGSVNHTAHEPNGWLEVTLAKPRHVESFAIYNMPDDEWDHRRRAHGHVVELFNADGQVVYSQVISEQTDGAFFDPHRGCCQKWVNAWPVVTASLEFGMDYLDDHAVVMATLQSSKGSQRSLHPFRVPVLAPGVMSYICGHIFFQSGITVPQQRLQLPDGRSVRLKGMEHDTFVDLVGNLMQEMSRCPGENGEPETRYVQPALVEGEFLTWEAVRKLRVSRDSADHPIHLKQVEIYGFENGSCPYGMNHALQDNGGSARQSSLNGDGQSYGLAECVIDGVRDGRCNHTAHEPGGWLEVTLQSPINVLGFAVFNMPDDEWDHRIRASGHLLELIDESDQVVYSQILSPSTDPAFFDAERGCCQKWVNDRPVVFLSLALTFYFDTLEIEASASLKLKETQQLPCFRVRRNDWDKVVESLCQTIFDLSGVPAECLRLWIPEGSAGRHVTMRSTELHAAIAL